MDRRFAILFVVFGAFLAICTGCKGFSQEPLTLASKGNSSKYKIGVEENSSTQEAVINQFPNAQIKPYPDLITAYFALQVGDIDVLAYNDIIITHTFNDSMSGLTFIENDVGIQVHETS